MLRSEHVVYDIDKVSDDRRQHLRGGEVKVIQKWDKRMVGIKAITCICYTCSYRMHMWSIAVI